MKVRFSVNGFIVGALILAVCVVGFIIWAEQTGRIRHVCVDEGVVKTIDRVTYRTAWFTLEDGREVSFTQPDIYPGKTICLKSKVVRDFSGVSKDS